MHNRLTLGRIALASSAIWAMPGCFSTLDVFGVEEIVTEHDDVTPPDDSIADKHPVFDATLTVQETFDGCTITLNKSASITRLDIEGLAGDDNTLNGRVFPDRSSALGALGSRATLPTMEVVNGALKPFNDGLYAAVELGAEDGSQGSLVNKRQVLTDVLAELVKRVTSGTAAEQPYAQQAAAQFAAAMQLTGSSPTAPDAVLSAANTLAAAFTADTIHSEPIGFYTWNAGLSGIFKRDRFLQSPPSIMPSAGVFAETAAALNTSPDLLTRYTQVLNLYAGLTNPAFGFSPVSMIPTPVASANVDVASAAQAFVAAHPGSGDPNSAECSRLLAFWPASDSPEIRLYRRLVCDLNQSVANANLLDVLISAIQNGQLDLTPTADSGWYDRQLYALQTLLVPDSASESQHLFLTSAYKQKLVDTFKSILIQTRETHVKEVMGGVVATSLEQPPVDIYPKLPVEPFPTFFLRTARAYRFVDTLLRTVMGTPFIDSASRLLEDGTRHAKTLGQELSEHEQLLYGLHVLSAASIGMRHEITSDEAQVFSPDAAATFATQWLTNWATDMDVNRDPRVALPVWIDYDKNLATYWAVVGIKVLRMRADFYPGFEPTIVDSDCKIGKFIPFEPYMLVEQSLEFQRPAGKAPLTRDQLRAILNQYQSLDQIKAALEGA